MVICSLLRLWIGTGWRIWLGWLILGRRSRIGSILITAFDFLVIIFGRIILCVLVFALVLCVGFGLRDPRYICKISKRKAR